MTTTPPTHDDDVRERRAAAPGRAAHSALGRTRPPLRWLPWAALALLLLLIGGAALIVRNVGDEGDDAGVDLTDDPAAADGSSTGAAGTLGGADAAPTGTASTGAGPTVTVPGAAAAPGNASATGSVPTPGGAANAAGGPQADPGSLTAGGQSLLPLPPAGLGALSGQAATGTAVNVESVVADEGFWVGSDATNRVFVRLTPEARSTQGESPFQVQAGQLINVEGTLIPLPDAPGTLGVDPAEGADQLLQQGHLIEATRIELT